MAGMKSDMELYNKGKSKMKATYKEKPSSTYHLKPNGQLKDKYAKNNESKAHSDFKSDMGIYTKSRNASPVIAEKLVLGSKDGGKSYSRNTIQSSKQRTSKVKKLEKEVNGKYGDAVAVESSPKIEGERRAKLMHARVAAAKSKKNGLQDLY